MPGKEKICKRFVGKTLLKEKVEVGTLSYSEIDLNPLIEKEKERGQGK